MIELEYRLIKYRDPGMHTFTFFWVNEKDRIVSPYFDSEREAQQWSSDNIRKDND